MFALMYYRQMQLTQAYDGLIASGTPLVGQYHGAYVVAGAGDDLGLYIAAPYLARWLGTDPVTAARLFLGGILVVASIVGLLGFWRLCKSRASRIYALIAYVALGGYAALIGDVYSVQFALPAAFMPWVIMALPARAEPPRWAGPFLLGLGVVGAGSHLIRGHSATAVFIGAVMLVLWTRTSVARKLRLVGVMAIGAALVLAAMSGLYASAEDFVAESGSGVDAAPARHLLWHSVYIGFAYLENPYVSEYKDRVAIARVASVDPSVEIGSLEYERILRDSVVGLAREHPWFFIRSLAAKTAAVLAYLFVIWELGLPNLGMLGLLRRRPDPSLLWMFAVMLGFLSLFGIFVYPLPEYVTGFITVSGLAGIVAADAALVPVRSREIALAEPEPVG